VVGKGCCRISQIGWDIGRYRKRLSRLAEPVDSAWQNAGRVLLTVEGETRRGGAS
jgi:hypothetical protein